MGLCMPRLQALRCTLKLSDDRWADNGPLHFPPRLTTLDITLTTEADDESAIQQFNEIVESLSHCNKPSLYAIIPQLSIIHHLSEVEFIWEETSSSSSSTASPSTTFNIDDDPYLREYSIAMDLVVPLVTSLGASCLFVLSLIFFLKIFIHSFIIVWESKISYPVFPLTAPKNRHSSIRGGGHLYDIRSHSKRGIDWSLLQIVCLCVLCKKNGGFKGLPKEFN